ncbi:TetR/AcrR family transcriptional regulator [Paraburkholderia aspalathi]|uniref:TetR/AcrR family transcriptional regulator n=1 Tax=Paraburkholderia aspalathi TaxID=1324617 RepID=UPI00190BFF5B|nr:TetR/AcrR family transcriptional regulator [Paraburkholderia aspalathi]MBK3816776.1 TetR/AcrR family transcriptional regulator [Paraburkholderia aspalathi]MBK3828674.1 TetR/AcrR family transcriptional regulator [Paraburkholderia aspalathi]MBK3858312.1 TetR/AcrR family transcriptional regulator [Paraburkholderia aspalathi]
MLFARVFRLQPKSDLTYNEIFTYIVYVYYNSNVKNQGIKTLPMPTAGPTPKSRREEYADATRQALIAAAGELFTSEGYQQVGIEAIARSARVTRGAFYHHFADKAELFDALVESLQADAASKVRSAAAAATPAKRMSAGIREFLEVCTEPAYRQLVIETAPAVLGQARCREIEEVHVYGLLIDALTNQSTGKEKTKAYLAARMIGSMVCEAAQLLDGADDPVALKAEALKLVESMAGTLTPDKSRVTSTRK